MSNKVFISYSLDNSDYARELAEILQHAGIDVWFDRTELKPGDAILDELQNALESASAIIVLLSKNYVTSNWAAFERGAAHALNKEILPIIIDDSINIPSDIIRPSVLDAKSMDTNKIVEKIQAVLGK